MLEIDKQPFRGELNIGYAVFIVCILVIQYFQWYNVEYPIIH